MSNYSVLYGVFGLVGLVAPILIVIGGVVVFRAMRNGGAILLIVGGGLGAVHKVCTVLIPFWMSSGMMEPGGTMFRVVYPIMSLAGILAWLLVAAGVLMLSLLVSSLRRQNEALEGIVAGSKTDRMA